MTGVFKDHGETIVGTLQRLPVLFWIDVLLRMYIVQKTSARNVCTLLAVVLIWLLVNNRLLGKIYECLVCLLFMIAMCPSADNHIWSILMSLKESSYQPLFSITQETSHVLLYDTLGVTFLIIAICLKMISLIYKLCICFPKRLVIIGICLKAITILSNSLNNIVATEFPKHYWVVLYHFAIIIITYHLFNLPLKVLLILLQIYLIIYWQNMQFYVINIVFCCILNALADSQGRHLIEHTITEIRKDYVNIMKTRIVFVLLPYEIVLAISIPIFLYSQHMFEVGTIFLKTTNIMCMTKVGAIAFITIISHICVFFPKATLWFLRGRNYTINTSELFMSAFVLGIVAIISVPSNVKFQGLSTCFGIFIVASSVLEEVHNIANSFLLEQGASRASILKTCKAVSIIILLIVIPILVVWKFYEFGFDLGIIWFLAATSSWIYVCTASIGSLAVYLLFVLDSLKSKPIEKLDEIIYGVRAALGIVHITFILLQVCSLTWNITTFQLSAIHILLAILVYDRYERVTGQWNDFQRRLTAVHRLSLLPNKTQNQLQCFNDVCAICLRKITSAKITPCNHYFHESCLKKWSYLNETCPNCNVIIDTEYLVQS